MKKIYALTPQQLLNHIQNMIRVYNDYSLSKKLEANNTYRVYAGSNFYLFQFFKTPEGTQLVVKAGKGFGKITNEAAVQLVNIFYERLDQIVTGRVVLTPEIVNRDVYKAGQGGIAILQVIKLIVALIAIGLALSVLMR